VDRYWLLTWTTYGTWLPGDLRGFVSNVRDGLGAEVRHNVAGTTYDANMPSLERSARAALKGTPVYLETGQAQVLIKQFRETATYRTWQLLAAAVMANHVHLVVGVVGDSEPSVLLASFKSYGSRTLSRLWGKPSSGTWWTESGSKRKLPNLDAVHAAIHYVERQACSLAVWVAPSEPPGERGA
jgi:REP element-mobilizing transposase RayT